MAFPDPAGIVLLTAAAGLAVQFRRLFRRWRIGQSVSIDWAAGMKRLARAYFHTVHDVVARDPYASRMHVLTAGGLVAALGLSTILHLPGLGGSPVAGRVLAAAVLAAATVALAGTAMVAWRRRPPRPARLTGRKFNLLPAALAGTLAFLMLAALKSWWAAETDIWLDAGWIVVAVVGFASLGTLVLWTVSGPMRHASAGVVHLLAHNRPGRFSGAIDSGLKPLDLAAFDAMDGAIPELGAATPASFSWNRLAQFDACVQCGRCQEACPAHAAGQPLNPKQVVQDLVGATTTAARGGSPAWLVAHSGRAGAVAPEALWACTTCRACVYECPMLIEHVDAIIDMRRYLTLERGEVPAKAAAALNELRATDTVAGRALDTRLDWAADLALPILAERGSAEVLLWLGEAAFDRRNQRTLRALVQLLHRAGVDFAVLGAEELDCGDLARRVGDEATFQDLARRNIATLARYRFDLVLTADPHAMHMLRNEYPAMGGRYEVVHHTEFLDGLLGAGKLSVVALTGGTVTYHDPCYLGRYNGEIAAPRRLLGRLGLELIEMELSGMRSRCCGGGGAASLADIPAPRRIPDMRMDQVRLTGAPAVAVACPTCAQMLEGVVGPRPAVADLAELVLERVAKSAPPLMAEPAV